jgi:hypothetical protein
MRWLMAALATMLAVADASADDFRIGERVRASRELIACRRAEAEKINEMMAARDHGAVGIAGERAFRQGNCVFFPEGSTLFVQSIGGPALDGQLMELRREGSPDAFWVPGVRDGALKKLER